MALNFNVDPYYDDFDDAKNFHRILFKPGKAVQARELTQAQTILQDQITKFANNIFKENSPVTGGQLTTNFNCFYIKLQSTYNGATIDVTDFNGLLLTNSIGTIRAKVIAVAQATGTSGQGDPPTLIVVYKSGTHFTDNDIIYDVNSTKACQAITNNSTGQSSVVSIAKGVFYVLGNFVQIEPITIILSKYDSTPSRRVGLEITETIYDYANDASLLDPAVGASNYQAPGADRYVISLELTSKPLYFGDDQFFIELLRIEDGNVFKMIDGSVYATIDDYFAKRDYETNGDYIVNDFTVTPKVDPDDEDKYIMGVGKGLAYVHGYRVENPSPINISSNRARTIDSKINDTTIINYGSYFIVSNVHGANSKTFDVTTANTIDLHCVSPNNVYTANATTYNSTLVARGYIRGLDYQSAPSANANTHIFKAMVYDLQNQALTGTVVSATSTTIVLPATNGLTSSIDGAYANVDISITAGTDAGETRTITSYVGSTRTATVNKAWSVTPDNTSTFVMNFDTTDTESMLQINTSNYTIYGKAKIDDTGKETGLSSGDAIFVNPNKPELIYPIGLRYVSGISRAYYTSFIEVRGVTFSVSGSTLSGVVDLSSYNNKIAHIGTAGQNLTSDLILENFTIIVTNAQSNSKFAAGDIVNWTVSPRTIGINNNLSVATLQTTTSDLTAFTATILLKVDVPVATDSGAILKIKNLVTANANTVVTSGTQVNTYTYVDDGVISSGQVYIQAAGVAAPGTKQSLYLSDVKRIIKIIDTKASGTVPLTSMYTNSTYDVTNNYVFDNGQRDGYYGHASITLKPGAPKPLGNLLVYLDYYKHSGGDGYFSQTSYISSNLPEQYREIGDYTSKNGTTYSLRDCLDFRPSRQNAQSDFVFRYSNPSDTIRFGILLPVDSTNFICDYQYYLGRKDKLVLTKDRSLQIVEGSPSINPILPNEPDSSLTIANITHNPYTGYVTTEAPIGKLPDLSIDKVQHRRYTMADIAGLDTRINRVEYYTSLNSLEQNANSLQISDAYGLNRFKNGIMVDDFSGFSASDSGITDYNANINRRTRQLTAGQNVNNFPLKNLAMVYNMNSPTTSSISGLNYSVSREGSVNYFTLPYTTTNLVAQKLASRTTNVNPFNTPFAKGSLSLTPNMDNWVDTTYSPSLLVVDPSLQVFQRGDVTNTLSFGDWQTVPGTSITSLQSQKSSPWATVSNTTGWTGGSTGLQQTTIQNSTLSSTYITKFKEQQNNLLGPYNKIDNTYALNDGYINDISILPWIKPQQIVIKASNLLIKTKLYAFFDNVSVDAYVRRLNTIEIASVTGTFKAGDIIGYYSSGTFTPTGKIEGVYNYTDTTKIRLYVSNDFKTTTYNNGLALQNGFFNASGVYQSSTASGSVVATQFSNSSEHYSGTLKDSASLTSVQLSPLASSTTNFYNGLTLYITSGANPGQSAVITAYNGTTKVATLATPIAVASVVGLPDRETYSIGSSTGSIETNERGDFFGVFTIPANTFHTGQKVFRLDNRINNNTATVSTYAEGTFYAEGLQINKQNIDFGASPAGAKDVFKQTLYKDSSYTTNTSEVQTRRIVTDLQPPPPPFADPVCQTFQIDPTNFPNGAFLSSIKVFFASKPTSTNDGSPITLSIVGTLNGYPNGTTLDHSIVILDPTQVKVSSTPQYLDSTTYTEFKFTAPVYIQTGVLYAFMLKSNSNEYTMWTASNNEEALPSTVKNLSTDPYPSSITKISSAYYVGGLFISQNSQTWEADQNQSLMFTVDRCVFNTSVTPSVRMVIPKKLPQRTLVDSEIDFYKNANTMTDLISTTSNSNILVDAFNISTTDFVPSSTSINYTYDATLQGETSAGQVAINPGKYGTTMYEHIYLDDNQGERLLIANSETSFSLYGQLSSLDNAVSPVISDAGTTVFTVQYNINNCELSNSLISIVSQGSSYDSSNTTVTISAPTGLNGTQAYASPVITSGKITSIYLTTPGSGYIETPTVSVVVGSGSASGASATITGETSKNGGPAATRYITKKVVLDAGFDSGDLNVYLSAYRPIGTDIQVYYKILNRNDTQAFADGSWKLMTKTKNCGTLYSNFRGDLHEYTFAPGIFGMEQGYVSYVSTNGQTYNLFNQFAIKIVLVTKDKTIVPYLTDMRCIALPSNFNSPIP